MKGQIFELEQIMEQETFVVERTCKELAPLRSKFEDLGLELHYKIHWFLLSNEELCFERPTSDYLSALFVYFDYKGKVSEEDSLFCYTQIAKVRKKKRGFLFTRLNRSDLSNNLTDYYNRIVERGFEKVCQETDASFEKIKKTVDCIKKIVYSAIGMIGSVGLAYLVYELVKFTL